MSNPNPASSSLAQICSSYSVCARIWAKSLTCDISLKLRHSPSLCPALRNGEDPKDSAKMLVGHNLAKSQCTRSKYKNTEIAFPYTSNRHLGTEIENTIYKTELDFKTLKSLGIHLTKYIQKLYSQHCKALLREN